MIKKATVVWTAPGNFYRKFSIIIRVENIMKVDSVSWPTIGSAMTISSMAKKLF